MTEDDVPVLVFEGPYAEALFLKTMLESAGIQTSLDDLTRGRVVGEPTLYVRRGDFEHASELVDDFRKNGHRTSF
jgi:pentatricopeptide repeat protein